MQSYDMMDEIIHQLCQIIAKANRTFVPKQEDDSHTNLFFDPIAGSIYGRWIAAEDRKIVLTLNLDDWRFEWLDDHFFVLKDYEIAGQTTPQIETAIAADLADFGLSAEGFREKLHFEITNYPFVESPFSELGAEGMAHWQEYRELANRACAAVLGHLQAGGETRIWPHHFDTGIYVTPNAQCGIGFGLAMQDSLLQTPYFYLSGYALQGAGFDYEQLNELSSGQWLVTEHWKGAVLPLPTLAALAKEERLPMIYQFVQGALSWYLK